MKITLHVELAEDASAAEFLREASDLPGVTAVERGGHGDDDGGDEGDEEPLTKEQFVAEVREGMREIHVAQQTGKRLPSLSDFLDEL